MASYGYLNTNLYNNKYGASLYWYIKSQDVNTNTSTIAWQAYRTKCGGGSVIISELSVWINNSRVYYRGYTNHTTCGEGELIASGTTTVKHNDDGTKTGMEMYIGAGVYNWEINCTKEVWNISLDPIPRASSITSAANIYLGEPCKIKWKPASSSFSYLLEFKLGDWSYKTETIYPKATSEYEYAEYRIPEDVANQIPNSMSSNMSVYLYTYNSNNEQIGAVSSGTFVVSIPETDSFRPSLSGVGININNPNKTVRNWGVAVSGYTKVDITAVASANYNAKITKIHISTSGEQTETKNVPQSSSTAIEYTSEIINTSGNKVFSIYVTDSRGMASNVIQTKGIEFYPYSSPTILSFMVSRNSANSEKVTSTTNWDFSSVDNKNESSVKLYYKESSEEEWTYCGEISGEQNGEKVELNAKYTFKENVSYDFKAVALDSLTAEENANYIETFISTAEVLLDFRAKGKGLGVGKMAEDDRLEIGLPTIFMNDEIKIEIMENGSRKEISLEDYIRRVINEEYIKTILAESS